MSASTVSITANTAARRRPVVIGEKKPNIELVSGDAGVSQFNGIAGEDRLTAGGGKDLSHSIRGETILERSKEAVQIKKASANAATEPRRTRKVVSKSERPRWVTAVSIFTKNLVLLVVILGLVQMIRKLALKSADSPGGSLVAVPDFERRIAEVQVEVVDRKIESEVGGLRRELSKKIEEKAGDFNNQLEKLDSKSETLEKKLGELGAMEFLRKEDFNKIFDELKNAKSADYGDREMSLDEIRGIAREIVEKEIERHAADGLGRVDYALGSGGAMVVRHSEPYILGKGSGWFPKTSLTGVHRDSEKMLKPSFGEPGQCFPLKGDSGFVQIRLRTAIIPEAITLEHVDKMAAYDRSSAPKDCRVYGWHQGHDTDIAAETGRMFLLAEFSYDLEKSNAQTFNVLDLVGSGLVDMVRFDFASNHGSPSHTCIYRLRVHGRESNSVSMLAMQS
ncbi:hypothetical protein PVL29_017182 [Vitis rotundifolia]|uniref:SUN domain-containing protein n=1 Tax=Vitis rotundifolia TaxID=103349 RepID=A0AA38Z9R9_VITRO|nr:hypothetical protein PVL29_017182 [Vitis rotundifolia]